MRSQRSVVPQICSGIASVCQLIAASDVWENTPPVSGPAEAPISCECPTSGVELNWCSESCLTTYVHKPEMIFLLGISLSKNLMVMSSDVQPQISIQGSGCKMGDVKRNQFLGKKDSMKRLKHFSYTKLLCTYIQCVYIYISIML